MASISENGQYWNRADAWLREGDEWSEDWGTAQAQWVGCLLPRVFPFLKGRILEIAPGRGRWTQFLRPYCSSLIGIDLARSCVERCAERFGHHSKLEFKVNDGLTFPMIENGSIDFAFSFDSLVHAESDVMSSYADELARVLKPGGVAFLHHSNLDAVRRRSVVDKVKRRLSRVPLSWHGRALSMSAEKMRTFVERAGMMCVQQEIIPWGTGWPLMTDCMSTIVNTPGNRCHVVRNPRFTEETAAIKRISSLCAGVSDDLLNTSLVPRQNEPGRRAAANLLTKDEARCIAATSPSCRTC
jgi:SAM-dependent methyltransferase